VVGARGRHGVGDPFPDSGGGDVACSRGVEDLLLGLAGNEAGSSRARPLLGLGAEGALVGSVMRPSL
jgi:hypothetical protein